MEIKIMVVPGKICRVELVNDMTVLAACEAAERLMPGIGWAELAKDREVRVQNRKFSNSTDCPDGFFGTIGGTALSDGDVVLILTKIKGNAPGLGVLTCFVDGQEYALETPVQARVVLAEVAGMDMDGVQAILVNGEEAELDRLVGNGDEIQILWKPEPEPEEEYEYDEYDEDEYEEDRPGQESEAAVAIASEEADTVSVVIDGHLVVGRPQDIKRILAS